MNQSARAPATENARTLFRGSCVALVATSVAFATVGAVMGELKTHFVLTNAQVGWIGGAALWGFALSQLIFSPFCDVLGMRALLRMAFASHLGGTLLMIFAPGYVALGAGAVVIAMGNGLVEAACNPLVATLYPNNRTVKLNRFHVWFPGGIALGGLASFALDAMGAGGWQLKLALILVPTVAYGLLLLGKDFPKTRSAQKGVTVSGMFRATFRTPLMYVLLACMCLTASLELGPNRWIVAVLESGGMHGVIVLAYINGLMAVLRLFAGPFVHRLTPLGVLLASAALAAAGLFLLSLGLESLVALLAAATIFALGVCYFWPTILGVVSERIPRSGALGLGLVGAVGMAFVGGVTVPSMGGVIDREGHRVLAPDETYAALADAARSLEDDAGVAGPLAQDLQAVLHDVRAVLQEADAGRDLPMGSTANALRAVINADAPSVDATAAQALLDRSDYEGGLASLRYLLPMAGVLAIIFGAMLWRDRRQSQ